jgi:hypothetical protein
MVYEFRNFTTRAEKAHEGRGRARFADRGKVYKDAGKADVSGKKIMIRWTDKILRRIV